MEQFDQQIEDRYWGVATALQHASEPPLQQKVATESLNELRTSLKELQELQEELRQQNAELVAEHQALEAERQRYQELFEFAPDAYLVTDAQGVIQEVNHACTTLLKVWQQFLVGKPLLAFVAKRERLSFHSKLTRLQQVDGVKDWEVSLCPSEGKPINSALNVAVVRNQEGKPVALRWLLRDITERKRLETALYQINEALNKEITSRQQTEQALRESEERFRSLVENALDMIAVLGADGTVVYANPSLERVLGYQPTKLVGEKLVDYIHPDDVTKAINSFTNAIAEPGVIPIELSFRHQDGSWRVLETISKKFIDQLGHMSVVLSCRDITERKQTEENWHLGKEKELSQLKLRFFSLASHEFRTPLSTILVSAQLLGCSGGEWPPEKRLRNVQRIEAAAKHMTHLLDDILTVNRAKTDLL